VNIKAILAPYVPTPLPVVKAMLDLASVSAGDILHDLGCGDGRICIAAARDYGARAVGIDIEPYWVEESRANALSAGVERLTTFELADACDWDVTEATVITMYLVHWSTQHMAREVLIRARPGTRIVSHSFAIQGCAPVCEQNIIDSQGKTQSIYLWVIGNNGTLIPK
jgi:SAM-dependent methyltransferase